MKKLLFLTILLFSISTQADETGDELVEMSAMCSAMMQLVAAGTDNGQATADVLEHAFWFNQWTSQELVTTDMEEMAAGLEEDWARVWPVLIEGVGMCILMKTDAMAAIEAAKE